MSFLGQPKHITGHFSFFDDLDLLPGDSMIGICNISEDFTVYYNHPLEASTDNCHDLILISYPDNSHFRF